MSDDKPFKHAGNTPEARARQLANLQPRAPLKHGAYSPAALAPERERVLGEMLASFPGVRRDRLELAAAQRARIVLLQAYVDTVGIIKHRGRGETYPAVSLLRSEEAAYRVELAKIEELARDAGTRPPQTLPEIEAEYARADDGGDA
ncbi:MAG: hypothetical protein ACYDHT_06615 [Solirubrobacteraceae bacterium]